MFCTFQFIRLLLPSLPPNAQLLKTSTTMATVNWNIHSAPISQPPIPSWQAECSSENFLEEDSDIITASIKKASGDVYVGLSVLNCYLPSLPAVALTS